MMWYEIEYRDRNTLGWHPNGLRCDDVSAAKKLLKDLRMDGAGEFEFRAVCCSRQELSL